MMYDLCVIGGGIVGLATAAAFMQQRPSAGVLVLEKETALGRHQTGHNSGVIHAGVYYKPGSLKADLCRRGAAATKQFCLAHAIPMQTRGKLVVATNAVELQRMEALRVNALANNIAVDVLDAQELSRREPNVTGLGALFVAETGIVDYGMICNALGEEIRANGGTIQFSAEVDAITETVGDVVISANGKSWRAKQLVVCGGLQSDRLAKLAGLEIDHQVIPFRGEYYDIIPEKSALVHHLIYPVPDPELPFLGIHLTPTVGGQLTVGPNAVLGFAREGYNRLSLDTRDMATYLAFPGFWNFARQKWRSGLSEMTNSLFKSRYLQECRKYCPSLEIGDFLPREAGIRAQAVMRDGTLVHDFLFHQTTRMLHVCNAPSPAATSAIPIAQMIVEKLIGQPADRPLVSV